MGINSSIFKKNLEKFGNEQLKVILGKVLEEAAREIVSFIEKAKAIPVYTGNLQDSTGVGVYMSGSLISYKPVKIAREPRIVNYGKGTMGEPNKEYWGTDELTRAIGAAASDYSSGFYIVVFSTMPYAYKVEETNDYFYNNMTSKLVESIKLALQA